MPLRLFLQRFQHIFDFSQQVGLVRDRPTDTNDYQLILGPMALVRAKVFPHDSLEPIAPHRTARFARDRDTELGSRLGALTRRFCGGLTRHSCGGPTHIFRFADDHLAPAPLTTLRVFSEHDTQERGASAQTELPPESVVIFPGPDHI